MMKKYKESGKSLGQFLFDETGLDMRGLENGKLVALTHEIVEKGKTNQDIIRHETMREYCEWLSQLTGYGTIPRDCMKHVAQVYSHLDKSEKAYIQKQLTSIRAGTYSGIEQKASEPSLMTAPVIA
jgi:hypothetical protein